MIFRLSQGGICDRFLEGTSFQALEANSSLRRIQDFSENPRKQVATFIFKSPMLIGVTLPETKITHENPHLSWYSKYHQNGRFSSQRC